MSKSETAFRPHSEISHRYDTVMLSVLVSLLWFKKKKKVLEQIMLSFSAVDSRRR